VRAARLWGVAEALRERIGAPLPPSEHARFERAVKRTQTHLDEAAFASAWAAGAAMTLANAVAYALR
jgi:hypothetical protein